LTTVGLNENHFQNTVDFYPNPTKGTLSIETGAIHKSLQIKIRNIHGQLVQEEQFVNQRNLQLQLNGKPGIYFIELVNEHGEWANVKVVKR
ncbi:MAG: T9SS type A sorting domain-containing protein, partial [Vicingaceae bacterium]